MANITDQFVTSFSELYYSTTPISGTVDATKIRSWFTNSAITEKESTITIATLVTIGNTFTVTLNDGTPVSFTAATTAGSAVVTALLASIKAVDGFSTSSASSLVITVKNGANYTIAVGGTGISNITLVDGSVVFIGATNLVPLVMEIGTLSNEATVIDTPTFGEVYRGKLRGQLDGGQLDAQLYWAPRNASHVELRELSETGVPVYVGVKWNSDSTATNSEYVYFNSFVSSFGIDTTFDDVAKVSCTFVVDGAEHFASDE